VEQQAKQQLPLPAAAYLQPEQMEAWSQAPQVQMAQVKSVEV